MTHIIVVGTVVITEVMDVDVGVVEVVLAPVVVPALLVGDGEEETFEGDAELDGAVVAEGVVVVAAAVDGVVEEPVE
jgi:hypothetical protein